MGIVGIRPEGEPTNVPRSTRRVPVHYTHLNSSLLRSIEIQNSTIKTERLPSAFSTNIKICRPKTTEPRSGLRQKCFNVMEIRQNETVVDGYYYENVWQYFDPIVRINFADASMSPA